MTQPVIDLPMPLKVGGKSPLEERFEGAVNLIIRTPNPKFAGKVFGILFQDGRAVINRHTRNPHRYTLAQLAVKFTVDLPGYFLHVEYADGRIEPPLPGEAEPGDPYALQGLTPDQAAARLSVSRGKTATAAPALTRKLKE